MLTSSRIRFAAKVAGCHFAINIVVAVLMAILVFYVWYPYPYRQMLGGLGLFALVIGIDVVCGPVLTAILANPKKSNREMLVDITLVAVIQLSALVYGLHTVAIARPVTVVFEVDRFVVVSAVDVHQESLARANAPFNRLPWFGQERVAIRPARDAAERNLDLTLSLQGVEPSMRPERWEADSSKTREAIRQRMQPASRLQQYYPQNIELTAAIQKSGIPTEKLYFLPFTSHNDKEWAVLLDESADFKGFVPVDAFLSNH